MLEVKFNNSVDGYGLYVHELIRDGVAEVGLIPHENETKQHTVKFFNDIHTNETVSPIDGSNVEDCLKTTLCQIAEQVSDCERLTISVVGMKDQQVCIERVFLNHDREDKSHSLHSDGLVLELETRESAKEIYCRLSDNIDIGLTDYDEEGMVDRNQEITSVENPTDFILIKGV